MKKSLQLALGVLYILDTPVLSFKAKKIFSPEGEKHVEISRNEFLNKHLSDENFGNYV